MIRLPAFFARPVALMAAAALALGAPAVAAPSAASAGKKRPAAASPARPLGVFTPSLIDPAPGASRPGGSADSRLFRFTPSAKPGALSLGARARPLLGERGEAEGGYDVGVALGLRGVAITGEASRVDTGLIERQAVTVGLGYGRRDWQTALRVAAEDGRARGPDPSLAARRYSVELGGSYLLRRNVTLGAGVRYRVVPEDAAVRTRERTAEDGAAFVGVDVAF